MMKIYDKKLAYPYFIWMVLFTVVPLIIVVYYALTDGSGNFTIANLTSVSGYGSAACCWPSSPPSSASSSRFRWAISCPACG
jgi:ABC-type uncharacterized transport system permease subunit